MMLVNVYLQECRFQDCNSKKKQFLEKENGQRCDLQKGMENDYMYEYLYTHTHMYVLDGWMDIQTLRYMYIYYYNICTVST